MLKDRTPIWNSFNRLQTAHGRGDFPQSLGLCGVECKRVRLSRMTMPPIHLGTIGDGGIGGEENDPAGRLPGRQAAPAPPSPEPTNKGRISLDGKPGVDQTRIGGKSTDGTFRAQPPAQLHGETDVAQLGLLVGQETGIAALKLEVVPAQTRALMRI